MTTDDLAGLLAEHYAMGVGTEGMVECTCGEGLVEFEIDHDPTPEHAAHQAAVIAAAGWVKGREEWGVRDGEDVDEINPPTREWAERVTAANNAHLRRNGMEGESIVVRRYVTDWEEAV